MLFFDVHALIGELASKVLKSWASPTPIGDWSHVGANTKVPWMLTFSSISGWMAQPATVLLVLLLRWLCISLCRYIIHRFTHLNRSWGSQFPPRPPGLQVFLHFVAFALLTFTFLRHLLESPSSRWAECLSDHDRFRRPTPPNPKRKRNGLKMLD